MEGFNSEFGEDEWIERNLPAPGVQTYVDAGCGHPIQFNNTAWLRRRGWRGVSIDGNPAYGPEWAELARGEMFIAAVLAATPKCRFKINPANSAISRIEPKGRAVPAVTLESILERAEITGEIGFLSLDLEGAEFDVFQTLDLARHRPEIIVAEYDTQGLGQDFRLRDFLLATGQYEVVHQTPANLIYRRK